MKRLALFGLILASAACGGEDEDGDAMAQEIGGVCVFTPGEYVINYAVLDTTSSCDDVDPLADEYLTVTANGMLVSTAGGTPAGCVDSAPVSDGCFGAFDRACVMNTAVGRVESTVGAQFDYAAGDGQVTVGLRLYSGTTLIDACTVNMGATIERL